MVSKYHSIIEKCLIELGKTHRDVESVHRGIKVPISLVDSNSKKVVNYQPDVYFVLKNRWKIIFQVLESELYQQNTIIADIVRACITENCRRIIFIHPSNKAEDVDRILEALLVIIRGLNKKGISLKKLPYPYTYKIIRKLSKNKEKTISLLRKYCKEDKWFS